MPFDSGSMERSAEAFLPYVGHVSPGVVLLDDGSVLAMLRVSGFPFELEEVAARNARVRQLNTLLRSIADDNVTLGAHFVRHRIEDDNRQVRGTSGFAGRLTADYERNFLAGLMRNDWFISIAVAPRLAAAGHLRRRLAELGLMHGAPGVGDTALGQLEDIAYIVMAYLSRTGAVRLGIRDAGGFAYSEIGEAIALILGARAEAVPVCAGPLGAAIYTSRAVCGRRGIEIQPAGRPYYGRIFGFKEYPGKTVVGQLNALLSVEYPCVLSQTFRFMSRSQSQTSLYLKRVRMENALDAAVSQIESLAGAADEVASGHSVRGEHQISYTVFADSGADLDKASADAKKLLNQAGVAAVPEGRGCFGAYWSQIPGAAPWLKTRLGQINTRNLTAFMSLDGYPEGRSDGAARWGRPVIRFRTTAGTPYDYEPHVGDVGHTLLIGRTGGGKTLLMAWIAVALEPVVTPTGGSIIILDKDRGNEIAIRAMGGRYLAPSPGKATGWAPLRALADTPENRAFLVAWLEGLIRLDGSAALLPDERRRLARGVARVLELPTDMRWISSVRQFLGFTDPKGVGARLERWCHDGALGWVFDNPADDLHLDRSMVGVDMTGFLEHEACPAIGAYLLYRIRALIDGRRRMAVFADEARFYLRNPFFAAMFEDFALTLRKQNGILFLATQQPEHILESPVGASLVAQCESRFLFPQKSVTPAAYLNGLGCTKAELRAVVEVMPAMPVRTVLLKRDSGSVILQTDLTGLEDAIAVLSGRTATVRLLDDIRAAVGDDPAEWMPVFLRRYPTVLGRHHGQELED